MLTLTHVDTLLIIIVLSWAGWFLIGLVRYIINYDDEIDERLLNVCR